MSYAVSGVGSTGASRSSDQAGPTQASEQSQRNDQEVDGTSHGQNLAAQEPGCRVTHPVAQPCFPLRERCVSGALRRDMGPFGLFTPTVVADRVGIGYRGSS